MEITASNVSPAYGPFAFWMRSSVKSTRSSGTSPASYFARLMPSAVALRSSTFSLPKRSSSAQTDDLAKMPGMLGLLQQKPGHRGAGDGAAALGERVSGDAVARGAVIG